VVADALPLPVERKHVVVVVVHRETRVNDFHGPGFQFVFVQFSVFVVHQSFPVGRPVRGLQGPEPAKQDLALSCFQGQNFDVAANVIPVGGKISGGRNDQPYIIENGFFAHIGFVRADEEAYMGFLFQDQAVDFNTDKRFSFHSCCEDEAVSFPFELDHVGRQRWGLDFLGIATGVSAELQRSKPVAMDNPVHVGRFGRQRIAYHDPDFPVGIHPFADKADPGLEQEIAFDGQRQKVKFVAAEPHVFPGPAKGIRIAGRIIRRRSF